jgi:hypothetical protein
MASSFKTSSGLPDNFEQDIEEFWFGKNPNSEQAADRINAVIRGRMVDLESGDVDEQHTLYLSCGNDWEVSKSGEAVKNKSGKGQFNKNSAFGRFIDGAVESGGDKLLELLESRGEAYEAEVWKNLRFRLERVQSSFTRDGEKIEYSYVKPVEYLGEIDDADEAPAKKPARGKAAAKPADKPAAAKPAATRGRAKKAAEVDLRTALVALAGEYEEEDFDSFIADIYDEDVFPRTAELEADEEVANAALDEDDIWAEAH